MKRIFLLTVVFILLAGILTVDAATTVSPHFPWKTEAVYWDPYTFDGSYASIAHHPNTGLAYISYYDSQNKDLKMARQVDPGTGNCGENNSWSCRVIDGENSAVGEYSSIDIVYVVRNPAALSYTKIGISYYDASHGALKYAEYRSNRLPAWTVQTVDQRVYVNYESRGMYSDLSFSPTHTATIAYHAQGWGSHDYGAVKLATFVGSGGQGCNSDFYDDWTCETVHKDDYESHGYNFTGSHISFDWDYAGQRHIAFYDKTYGELMLASSVGTGGSCSNSVWDCVVVDGDGAQGGITGFSTSLHAKDSANDVTMLAYWDISRNLRFAASTSSGTGGNCKSKAFNCFTMVQVGDPPEFYSADAYGLSQLSLTVDSQRHPILVYSDGYNLKMARPKSVYGYDVGNCGRVFTSGPFEFYCKTIDSQFDNYGYVGHHASVSINPSGVPMIAYTEDYPYEPYERILKVAYQAIPVYLPLIMNGSLCSKVPTLLEPANGASLNTLIPLFRWDDGDDPNSTQLRLDISNNADFTDVISNISTGGSNGVGEFRLSYNLDPSNTIFWRTYLMCGDTKGPYSPTWSFTTGSGGTVLPAPSLIAPADDITLPSLPVNLSWSPVNGTVEYLVHWTLTGHTGYTNSRTNNLNFTINSGLDPSATYDWWITARNDYAWGADSVKRQFTTPAETLSITDEDLTPLLIVEQDGEVFITSE